MKIILKNGTEKEYANGITAYEIARDLSEGLARVACAAKVNADVVDLRRPITEDCTLEILTFDDPDGRKALRHTVSHILAQAVKRLYPGAKLAIGSYGASDLTSGRTTKSELTKRRVCPSAVALAAARVPMSPPAPARFST